MPFDPRQPPLQRGPAAAAAPAEAAAGVSADAWAPTLQFTGPATQVLDDREQAATPGVGRRVAEHVWELFVVFDPAHALEQQFDLHPDPFVALHDVGAPTSRRWLAELAAGRGLPLNRLVVRSQGHGVALATIEFVELPVPGSSPVRLYATDVDADTRQRQQIARVLMAASRLGAVIVADLAPHALPAALRPLHDAIQAGPWRNRELLLLPLPGGSSLSQQALQLAAGTSVHVGVAPPVAGPDAAFVHVTATWNQMHKTAPAGAAPVAPIVLPPALSTTIARGAALAPAHSDTAATLPPPVPAAAPAATMTTALPMQPMPDPKAALRDAATATPMQRYVQRCLEVKGMVSCCVFEPESQLTLAFAGARPGPAQLATHGAALFAALSGSARALGLGTTPPEAVITLAGHFLVLRPVPGHPGLVLHAVIDRTATALVLAVRHLERIDEVLRPA